MIFTCVTGRESINTMLIVRANDPRPPTNGGALKGFPPKAG